MKCRVVGPVMVKSGNSAVFHKGGGKVIEVDDDLAKSLVNLEPVEEPESDDKKSDKKDVVEAKSAPAVESNKPEVAEDRTVK